MQKVNSEQSWNDYKHSELSGVIPVIKKLGFLLDEEQVHIGGERHLMSGHKLVLTGKCKDDNHRIIIKLSSHKEGILEIKNEHNIYQKIKKLSFAYYKFILPKELLFTRNSKYTILITEFIGQEKPFTERSLEEQFFLSLNTLKIQEGVHAIARSHMKTIHKTFDIVDAKYYIKSCDEFIKIIKDSLPKNTELIELLNKALFFIKRHSRIINMYSGFLTHTDFVPHNIRISQGKTYLIDHTSLHFGNKYEGWARFINYMELHNPELASLLLKYIRENRGESELLSLRIMRIYKLCFLLQFYSSAIMKTSGKLNELSRERVLFWSQILKSILNDTLVDQEIVYEYKKMRNKLRSKSEKKRQEQL